MDIVPQLTLNSIIAASIYALIALGFNLIFGVTKFFNLAHGVLSAVGGYAALFLLKSLGLNLPIAVVLAVILTGLVGWLLDKVIYSNLRKQKASNTVQLVASLGAFTVIQAVIAILFTSQFQTLSTRTETTYTINTAVITQTQLTMVLSVLLIMVGLAWWLYKTRTGMAIRAISDDAEVAKITGINTDKITGTVFFIGSAIAGLAGILVGLDTGLEPTMGMSLLLKGTIASIIGGVGNVYGGILGALLLGFAENFGIWKISGEWKDAIAFILLLVFLLFRPSGILRK